MPRKPWSITSLSSHVRRWDDAVTAGYRTRTLRSFRGAAEVIEAAMGQIHPETPRTASVVTPHKILDRHLHPCDMSVVYQRRISRWRSGEGTGQVVAVFLCRKNWPVSDGANWRQTWSFVRPY